MRFVQKLFILSMLSIPISVMNPLSQSARIETKEQELVEKINPTIKRAFDPEEEYEYEDVVELAFDELIGALSNYINIYGLNVTEKESITIPEYNPDYVLPDIEDMIPEVYENNFEDFGSEEIQTLEERRQANRHFDHYYGVIEDHFEDVEIDDDDGTIIHPKYGHPHYSHNPNDPIIALGVLLAGLGVASGYIVAMQAAGATLVATAPVAWFLPYSVPVTLAALATITIVIIAIWPLICEVIQAIINLFILMIAALAYIIVQFFEWVLTQVTVSSTAGAQTIGNQTFEFVEVRTNDVAKTISIVEASRRKYDVFLMQYVNNDSFQIALGTPVTESFCVTYQTHTLGLSSYTWYQNVARRLIINAGSGVTTAVPELDVGGSLPFGFKHFHNYEYIPGTTILQRSDNEHLHRTHSMFGLLYYYGGLDGNGSPIVGIHPDNPTP